MGFFESYYLVKRFTKDTNLKIITYSIRFIRDSKRFDKSIFFVRNLFDIFSRQ